MDWENHLDKNPMQKIEKTVKIKMKLPHVNKKTPSQLKMHERMKKSRFEVVVTSYGRNKNSAK